MKFEKTKIDGVYIINNFIAKDNRGAFIKTFNHKSYENNLINFNIKESYYSISKKNVIRGMHFQIPPKDHEKLVYVPFGSILDVVVDLRPNSKTYKNHISVILSDKNNKSIFIPKGIAHGYKSLENNSITVYNVATGYDPNTDDGIKYNSFGFDWQIKKPILSSRDENFLTMNDFCKNNKF